MPSCPLCGEADALRAGVCAACGGDPGGRSLVFVRPVRTRSERAAIADRLNDLVGDRMETPDGRAAASGALALYRVPPSLAVRIVSGLEERGIPARAVPPERAWSAMPAHFFVMLGAIVLAGGMAGLVAAPTYLWLSPLLAGTLLLIAQRAMRDRVLVPPANDVALPASTESTLVDALAALPDARARGLLGDVGRIARPLARSVQRDGDPGGLRDCISDLVVAAAATALEVARLEETVAVLEDHDGADADPPAAARTAAIVERCREAAATGTRQLVDAVAMLGQVGESAGIDARVGVRLAALTRDFVAAASQRERAIRDVTRLLGPA